MNAGDEAWWQPNRFGCYHEVIGTQDVTGVTFFACHGASCPYFNPDQACVHAQLMTTETGEPWWRQDRFDCCNPDFGGPPPTGFVGPCMGEDCWLFNESVVCPHATLAEEI